jgi:ubiquinone/menaquinone biosynthesis C-methylase UbiE
MGEGAGGQSSEYIHGADPEEQERLSLLNELINGPMMRELGLAGGQRVLDLGCGLAQFSREMARVVGASGRVVGVEREVLQLEEAARQAQAAGEADLVELRQGDVLALPLSHEEWGSFDLVHARFLLEHLADPLAAVRLMVRAARPGGRIVLADDDHDLLRLHPEPPGLGPLWQAYIRSYDRLGNDPYVGRRLVQLLVAAGARPVRNTLIFFGGCAGTPAFAAVSDNLIAILRGVRAQLLALSLIDPASFDAAIVALEAWSARPDGAFWYTINWAEGMRP